MKFLLLGILLASAHAQQTLRVKRGDLSVQVPVGGTVIVSDTIRLKAQIEGRVEDVAVSSYSWVLSGHPLGYLASKEMAAILDSHTTTVKGTVEERWREVYRPTPIECPDTCYVMRVFVRNKEWLKPHALLFEAARRVQLVGRVRPEDAHWVRDGQIIEFWPKNDPRRVQRTRVRRYVLDVQATHVAPGGSFAVDLTPKTYLDPGTEWEGRIIPLTRKDVLMVPTSALIDHDGSTYLAVRVTTGVTTDDVTELTSGVDDKRPVLLLDASKLGDATRHKHLPDQGALDQRLREQATRKPEAPAPAPSSDGPLPDTTVPQSAQESVTPVPSRRERPERERDQKSGVLADPDATYSESPNGN